MVAGEPSRRNRNKEDYCFRIVSVHGNFCYLPYVTNFVYVMIFKECSEKDPLLNRPIKIPVLLPAKKYGTIGSVQKM